MIQVNLLPGGKKRQARGRKLAFTLPKFSGVSQDRWVLVAAAVGALVLLGSAFLYFSLSSDREEVQVAYDEARQDSARYADLIARTNSLIARRDSIVQKVGIIQEIDQGRYVWPHLLDEISRAVPDYTWLTEIQQVSSGAEPRVRIAGQAGNNFALAVFMRELEASPFLRSVRLSSTQQQLVNFGVEGQQLVYIFDLEVSYEQPPMEFLETVPLLGAPTEAEAAAPSGL